MSPLNSSYREISLTQGQVALVDTEDFERINARKWCARWSKGTKSFYAVSRIHLGERKQRTIYMHREVLGLQFMDHKIGEHRDPNQTLDNRHSNLRVSTQSQNGANARKSRRNPKGLKGVSFNCHSRSKRLWTARIMVKGKSIWLGRFWTQQEAHEAYKVAAVRFHGEFARFA